MMKKRRAKKVEIRNAALSASALHGDGVKEAAAEMLGLTPAKSADRTGRRPARVVAIIVIVALVGGAAVFLSKFINGPVSVGALAATPTPTTKPVIGKTGTVELGGLNFEMTYPAVFDQMSQVKNDRQALEQYYITSKAEYSRSLAVTVRPLASSNIEDDASYKFRKIHPAEYKERLVMMAGDRAAVLSKTDNTEATLFWAHEGKMLTVAIVTTSPKDKVADFMSVIEPKLRWKK